MEKVPLTSRFIKHSVQSEPSSSYRGEGGLMAQCWRSPSMSLWCRAQG